MAAFYLESMNKMFKETAGNQFKNMYERIDTTLKMKGYQIRRVRILKGMTQEEFATLCGISRTKLIRIEIKDRNVTAPEKQLIMTGFNEIGITPDLFTQLNEEIEILLTKGAV
ncbi:helix-turn-helix domain-containing protein [Bacillus manliponensis]|uniref:helix-turn-helix domain-containing protein n=1 Tax=Bacillus manliponensis TaxID=574376 RepID=UPI00351138E3